MKEQTIKRILKENKGAFDMLEHYDKTGELLASRKRIDLTLDLRVIKKLKETRERTGKPVSRIVEECLKSCL